MQISILLPVFNTEQYLPGCLESILSQTEQDWELLAVDDFSTDKSWAVLETYEERDQRIKIFKNEVKGIAPALQLAYKKASGRLITRMDSDDLMLPEKLATLKSDLQAQGAGHLAIGQVEYFSENGVGDGYRKYADWLNGLSSQGQNFAEIYKECTVPSPCWMAFRSDLKKAGAFETTVYPEDYDLCFRLRKIGLKITPSECILHRWRDRPDRASRTDPNYRDNTFLTLKTDWFLQTDHDPARPLVVWGAGKKGKRLARLLNEQQISFGWVTNNPDKIGHEIRGVELREVNVLRQLKNPQIIVAVASPNDQAEILTFFQEQDFTAGENYFFFC